MSIGQTPRILGPGITMNYTLTFMPDFQGSVATNISIDTPLGMSSDVNPSSISLGNQSMAADVSFHASDSIAPGSYDVTLRAVWATGSYNLTYRFTVVQHLVLLVGGYVHAGGFKPENLTVHAGESILWLSVDPGGDEFGGLRQVRIVEENATSPTLSLYSSWSFTFNRAGTFHIDDPLNLAAVPDGYVVVS